MQLPHQKVARDPAQRRDRPRQRHLDQRDAAAGAALAQHHQIAHVVRHLVRQHRQRRHQPQTHVSQEGGSNQHPIAKAMHAVAGQHRPATALRRGVVVMVLMAMRVAV